MQKILIVIDMQTDFVTGALGSEAAQAIVPGVQAKIEQYEREGLPVIFTMDTHQETEYDGEGGSIEARRIPRHCVEGTAGWELTPGLQARATASRSVKPTFLSTSLAGEIRSEWGGEAAFELCGVCTDICVVSNALMLRGEFPDSPISVDAACCAGTSPEAHQAALTVMSSCLIDVINR